MAFLHEDAPAAAVTEIEGQTTQDAPNDYDLLHQINDNLDQNGAISKQIHECLQKNGITLKMLSEFDNISVNGKELTSALTAILINNIKQLKQTANKTNETDENYTQCDNKQRKKREEIDINGVITETEMKMIESLKKYA